MFWKSVGPSRFKVNNVINFSGKYIYLNDKTSSKYNLICGKLIKILVRDICIIVIVIIISYLLLAGNVFYAIFFENVRITFLSTELPFIDFDSNVGYTINIIQQLFFCIVALIGFIAVEIQTCFLSNVSKAVPELIHLQLQELNSEFKINAKIKLRNTLMQIRDYNR